MRCRTCQYPLWRLKARNCPECGTPFSPADYEFVPFSVRFRCPHCAQEYYGDGERGQLSPPEFDCVRCGQRITMAEMVVEPAAGVEEEKTQTRKVPWLERDAIGWWRAWIKTIGMAMVAPGDLVGALPKDEPTFRHAWRFFFVTQLLIWLVAAVPLWGIMGVQLASRATGRSGGPLGPDVVALLVLFGVGLIGTLAAGLIFALVAHVVLILTGPREGGLGRTMTAMAYSSGANVLTAIPCLGLSFGWIWWVASATAMLGRIQRVRMWRAVVAVVAPVAVAIVLFAGAYAWFVYWAISQTSAIAARSSAAAAAAASGLPGPDSRSAAVAKALIARAQGSGTWPGHLGELLADGTIGDDQLAGPPDPWSQTTPDDIRFGGLTLAAFADATPEQRARAASNAATSIAPSDAAYRVGDFVVCVRPNQPVVADPGIWLVISWPDPDATGNTEPTICFVTGDDGVPTPIFAWQFDTQLQAQNFLRSRSGLPPLPHPRDVHQPKPSPEGSD